MSATGSEDLEFATTLAREAGTLLRRHFGEAQEIDYKGRINLVTRMDHESDPRRSGDGSRHRIGSRQSIFLHW